MVTSFEHDHHLKKDPFRDRASVVIVDYGKLESLTADGDLLQRNGTLLESVRLGVFLLTRCPDPGREPEREH